MDYLARKNNLDKVYQTEYKKWFMSLPASEKAELRKQGLDQPEADKACNNNDQDISDSPLACEGATYPEDSLEDQFLQETQGMTKEEAILYCAEKHRLAIQVADRWNQAQTLARIVPALLMRDNAKMQAYGIMFASGLHQAEGITMTQAAQKMNVTRAAISKIAVQWTKILNLPASNYMKSEKSRKSFSEAQHKKHWRKMKL